jgi:hypothetical protein
MTIVKGGVFGGENQWVGRGGKERVKGVGLNIIEVHYILLYKCMRTAQ